MRRFWCDKLHPLLWWVAFIVLMYAVVDASIVPADAAPTTPGERFAAEHAADICIALDTHPTVPGVLGVLTSLDAYGLSAHESGVAVVTSVMNICPIHANLLRQFVDHYRKDRAA